MKSFMVLPIRQNGSHEPSQSAVDMHQQEKYAIFLFLVLKSCLLMWLLAYVVPVLGSRYGMEDRIVCLLVPISTY
jgi:hypothetical protein